MDFIRKLIFNFDNSFWRTFSLLLIVSNFIYLFDPEIVLLFSLCFIFIYLFYLSLSFIISNIKKDKMEILNRIKFYILKSLDNMTFLKQEYYNLFDKANFISFLRSFKFNNHSFYRCIHIPKNLNMISFFGFGVLEKIFLKQYKKVFLNLSLKETKNSLLK